MTWFWKSAETDGTRMAGGWPEELREATGGILSGGRLKNKYGSRGRSGIPDLPDLRRMQSTQNPHFPLRTALLVDFSSEFCENRPRRSYRRKRLQR
jgi:hypothetical protein